jgi:hypothetical protein
MRRARGDKADCGPQSFDVQTASAETSARCSALSDDFRTQFRQVYAAGEPPARAAGFGRLCLSGGMAATPGPGPIPPLTIALGTTVVHPNSDAAIRVSFLCFGAISDKELPRRESITDAARQTKGAA